MTTITRSYDDFDDARAAVRELKDLGISDSNISFIANEKVTKGRRNITGDKPKDSVADGVATGAGVGGVIGAAAGLLTGLGLLAIPGVGPVVAAGWLATTAAGTAAGAAAGAATGGIIDALTSSGVDERDAHVFAETVRRGGIIVSARVPEDQALRAQEILDHHNPIDLELRRQRLEGTGWSSFDPNAGSYTDPQMDPQRRDRF